MDKSETEAPSRNKNKNGDFGRFSGGFGRRMGCAVKEDTKIFRFSLLCYSRPKAASEAAAVRGEIVFLFLLSSFGDGPRGRSHSYFITVDKKCVLSGI